MTRSANTLLRISAADSSQSVIVQFPPTIGPWGLDIGPTGNIYVADCCGGLGHVGRILLVDADTGAYQIVSEGGFLVSPADVEVLPTGELVVADPGSLGGQGAILKINPASGSQDILASSNRFPQPGSVSAGDAGEIYFLDLGGAAGGVDFPNSIYRLDLATLDTTLVSSGGFLQHGLFLTYANGALYLADNPTDTKGGGLVFRVDPLSGAQSLISSGGYLTGPVGVAWRSAGCLAVAEARYPSFNFEIGAILCIDRQSGDQDPISIGQYLGGWDLAVFDGGVTPARRTTWGSIKARYR